MSACKEIWSGWVEAYRLNYSFGFRKRSIRSCSTQTMNHDLAGCLDIISHRSKIVSLRMPYQFTNNMLEFDLDCLCVR